MEEIIRGIVTEELARMGAGDASFAVEWPADMAHGDFAVNAALAASKALGKPPREVAETLVDALRAGLGALAASVEVAGPGFINVTLSADAIAIEIAPAFASAEQWGGNADHKDMRVMVEYTDPNPFKEMHIGHLMSNVIGESVARLTEFSGTSLMRANFQGDVGPHVAKAIWALQKKGITEPGSAKEIGDAYSHGSRAYEESAGAKAEIDALNTAVYEGTDEALMELWRKGRDMSLSAFEDLYRTLGTKFDYYFFESETAETGLDIVKDHVGTVFTESEGAVIYEGEKKEGKEGLHTLVFITSRGTPTYETKDIGLAFAKEEAWPSDLSIILTAAEQNGHFKVMLAALEEIAPALAQKTVHVPHGFLRLSTGKMSSREGNVVTAASLLGEVTEATAARNSDTMIAAQVALGAIKYSILKQSAGSDIIFDFDKSLSLDGDSGPYLQYALVRALSILEKAGAADLALPATGELLSRTKLARLVMRFPGIVRKAQELRAPHVVAQYLTQLASEWNAFYAQERIIGEPDEAAKLALAKAFAVTMQNGLWLLGMPAPERM